MKHTNKDKRDKASKREKIRMERRNKHARRLAFAYGAAA